MNKPGLHYTLSTLLVSIFVIHVMHGQQTNYVLPKDAYVTQFQDVVVDNNGHGFAVGTCNIIVETTDNGDSWTPIAPPNDGLDFERVFCPDNDCDEAVIFGDATFFLRRANESYFQTAQSDEFRWIEYIRQLANGDLLASDDFNDFFLRSIDGGLSWQRTMLPTDKKSVVAVVPNSMTVFYFDEDGACQKSTDGAQNFAPTGYVLPEDNIFPTRWVYFLNESIGWLYNSRERAFMRTEDGGVNWVQLTHNVNFSSPIGVIPLSADTVLCISIVDNCRISYDSARTWEPIDELQSLWSEVSSRPYSIMQSGDQFFLSGGTSTIIKSTSGLDGWTANQSSPRERLTDYFSFNDQMIARGLTALFYSANNGADWTDILVNYPMTPSNPGRRVSDVLFLDEDRFVVVDWTNPSISISSDRGQSFSEWLPADIIQEMDEASDAPDFIERAPNGRIYVLSRLNLYYTDDEGQTWNKLNHGFENFNKNTFYVYDENTFYIGSSNFSYYKTVNGGASWDTTVVDSGFFSRRVEHFLFFNDDEGILQMESDFQYRTMDGGDTWVREGDQVVGVSYDPETEMVYAADFASGNNGVFLRSPDLGRNYEQLDYNCVSARGGGLSGDRKYYFTLNDAGYIRKHEVPPLVSTEQPASRAKTQSLKVFPNPAQELIVVQLPHNPQGGVLQLFSFSGQSEYRTRLSAVQDQYEMNLGHLSPGLYLMHWFGDDGRSMSAKVLRQ